MKTPTPFPEVVIDEQGNLHRLTEKLGQGGQGAVFRTTDANIAVKIVTKNDLPVTDEAERKRIHRRIENIRLLPLDGLKIAKPVALLQPPSVGYVMQLLTGMVPLKNLLANPEEDLAHFYIRTGGLKRRLELLKKTASILARLHAIPLVYADVSWNNIFVSEDTDANEVWLIDADNLHFQRPNAPAICTPIFGAPEVVSGKSGVHSLTDAYSFAILAYYVLAQRHPFEGDLVEYDESEDEDAWPRALTGELPWVCDLEHVDNHTEKGLQPKDLVLSKGLESLFQQMFGPGRSAPLVRPGLQKWVTELHQAADMALFCPKCGSSYYPKHKTCPFCLQPRPSFYWLQVRRWDPEFDEGIFDAAAGKKLKASVEHPEGTNPSYAAPLIWQAAFNEYPPGTRVPLCKHLFKSMLLREKNLVAVEFEFLRNGVRLHPRPEVLAGCMLSVAQRKENELFEFLEQPKTFKPPKGRSVLLFHCGSQETHHRLIQIRHVGGQ